jgi:hypothetical protein
MPAFAGMTPLVPDGRRANGVIAPTTQAAVDPSDASGYASREKQLHRGPRPHCRVIPTQNIGTGTHKSHPQPPHVKAPRASSTFRASYGKMPGTLIL